MWLVLAVICLLLGSPAFANAATVLSVGDGDTLRVSDEGRRLTVRLACIDAPETAHAPYGAKASATFQALAPVGSTVTVQVSEKDRYGRTVSEVLRGRTNVNLEQVRRGDAFVGYRQYLSGCDRNAYLSAEKQAEKAHSGVWSVAGGITRPWDWRRSRADSKCQLGFSLGCRIAIARSALMSCITAYRPSRIESNPARRSRFSAAVRSVASTPAPLPR